MPNSINSQQIIIDSVGNVQLPRPSVQIHSAVLISSGNNAEMRVSGANAVTVHLAANDAYSTVIRVFEPQYTITSPLTVHTASKGTLYLRYMPGV